MSDNDVNFDDYAPANIAKRVEAAGVKKANLNFLSLFLLSVLAGSFIAMGCIFYIMVTFDSTLPSGITRLIGGLVFCIGLILVVVAGAELFTGNNLLVMGLFSRVVRMSQLLKNWGIVYVGNFIGSISVVALMFYSNIWKTGSFGYGAKAVIIAAGKVNLTFTEGLTRGILCNVLVCLAVWMCFGSRQIVGKIAAIIFPITTFIALGFEHSIANMFYLPFGIILKRNPQILDAVAKMSPDLNLSHLTVYGMLGNLLSVTIGNIIGGAVLIGTIYWLIIILPEKRKSKLAK